MTPSSVNAGLSPASFSTVVPRRMPSSSVTDVAVGEHRHDLVVERAGVLRGGGPLVRPRRVLVEPGPRQAPLLRDHLGGDALVERETVIAGKDFRAVRHAGGARRTERHPAHHLDTACDDDVLLTGHDGLRREVQRLLARSAGPVDRGARDGLGPARGQHRVAADVAGLVAHLGHAAPHHVVDDVGIDTRCARTSALSTTADRSAACTSASPPLRLPTGVRTASDDDGLTHYFSSVSSGCCGGHAPSAR